MAIPLSSAATNVLANALGSSSIAYNSLVSAAQTSPYLAGLLNDFAANGGTINVGSGADIGYNANTITIASTALPTQTSGENALTFATTIAHELGHADLPQLPIYGTATDVQQAMQQGDSNEGVAMVAEYIVATQLGLPNGVVTTHSDPNNIITPTLNGIVQAAGIDVS
jgi:hypothetical protein